jgi:hypothetical protein
MAPALPAGKPCVLSYIKVLLFTLIIAAGSEEPGLLAGEPVLSVRDFGATGSRADDATPAFRGALEACRHAGGGTVYVPAGEYRCLPMTLSDNVTLDIAAGAVLFVDLQNPAFGAKGFIGAERARNITIKGKGVIDGQAKYVWADYRNDDVEIAKEVELARHAGLEMKRSYRLGNTAFMFLFKECENLRIEGITALNSSSWCMKIWGSRGVTIDGVTIRSDLKMGVNSDGIDIDGTSDVHIRGCNISTGDDAICLKTGAWEHRSVGHVYQPVGEVYPTENVIVDDCILTSSSTALMIGTETCSNVRHVVFNKCLIRDSNKGLGINVQDGGTVSDILYSNVTMGLSRRHWSWWGDAEMFHFVLKKRLPDSKIGMIKNVTLIHVIAHAQGTSRIETLTGQPIENISMEDVHLVMDPEQTPDKRSTHAISVAGVNHLRLRRVDIRWTDAKPEPAWQSALALKDASEFELDNISVRQGLPGSTIPAIILENARDGVIRNCLTQADTGLFLKVQGPRTTHLLLSNNFADNASSFIELDKAVNREAIQIR